MVALIFDIFLLLSSIDISIKGSDFFSESCIRLSQTLCLLLSEAVSSTQKDSINQTRKMTNLLQRITQIALIAIPTTIGILQFSTLSAMAADRFAVFCLKNETKATIRYWIKWGKNGAWETNSLSSGESWRHWLRFERANQSSWPAPQIKFDSDLRRKAGNGMPRQKRRNAKYFIPYSLQAYAAPEPSCSYGKMYSFEYDGESGTYVDLIPQ